MGRTSTEPSAAVACLLRERRAELGLTLRNVHESTERLGRGIPFTTLAKIEQARIDPGVRRLHLLLRLYDLPLDVAVDALDLEELADDLPAADRSAQQIHRDGIEAWKAGDLRRGLGHLVTLGRKRKELPDLDRQRALLGFAVSLGSLGKFRTSQRIINDLLLEPPVDELAVNVLIQAAVCWHWLGSGDGALAFLDRAEQRLAPGDHQKLAWVHHERASALATMVRSEAGERELRLALAAYQEAGDPYGESRALAVRVRLSRQQGDHAGALEAARAALEHAREHGFARLITLRRVDEGSTLADLGRLDDALDTLSRALAEAITAGDPVARFYVHHALWKTQLARDDAAAAINELQNARYYVQFVDERTPEVWEIRDEG